MIIQQKLLNAKKKNEEKKHIIIEIKVCLPNGTDRTEQHHDSTAGQHHAEQPPPSATVSQVLSDHWLTGSGMV